MDEVFILRAIYNNDKGTQIAEAWHIFEDMKEMTEKVWQLDPDSYQCFTAHDLTNEIFFEVERRRDEDELKERRKLYEQLKKEFDE